MKKLIVVCGSPAAGKSSYAKKIAPDMSAIIVDIDSCTEQIIQIALSESGRDPNDRDSPYFKEKYREAVYNTLFAIAKDNLTHSNVIIIGPFTKEIRDPDWPNLIAQRLGVTPEVYYLVCNPQTRKARMTDRANARDKSKLANWEDYLLYYGEEKPPAFKHFIVDTN